MGTHGGSCRDRNVSVLPGNAGSEAVATLAVTSLPKLTHLQDLKLQGVTRVALCRSIVRHCDLTRHGCDPDNDASLQSIATVMSSALPHLVRLEHLALSGEQAAWHCVRGDLL